MKVGNTAVIVGGLLLIGSAIPVGIAHVAQNPSQMGSATSAGFGGPVSDPDPCRRESSQDALANPLGNTPNPVPSELPGDVCLEPNNGVSGTYAGSLFLTAVECLGSLDNAGLPNGSHALCDSLAFGSGWGAAGQTFCDLESFPAPGVNEGFIDNQAVPGDLALPDGTWDDGGLGGACHVSVYPAAANAGNTNPPNPNNTALTKCEGTTYAEDWMLGADVPIIVTCDFAEFMTASVLPPAVYPGLPNCIITPEPEPEVMAECIAGRTTRGLNQIVNPPSNGFASCTRDRTTDVATLGKGGGHVGDGVTVPNLTHISNDTIRQVVQNSCTISTGGETFVPGDIMVFVSNLVSANPFGQAYTAENDNTHNSGVDEHFGWPGVDSDAQALSDWNNDGQFEGSGDTIVYPATGGWIDHFFDRFTSPDAVQCHFHADHWSSHNHGPTGLSQDDHVGLPSPTIHTGPTNCGPGGSGGGGGTGIGTGSN